jgi:hypothetical protein
MPNLRDGTLRKLLRNNTSLVYLCLEKSYNAVNAYSIGQLAVTCGAIKTLSLSYCTNVCDRCVDAISQLPALRELSLAHCYDVSARALSNLCRSRPELTILSLECETY